MPAISTSIVGFDSAWTDNPKAPGAICAIRLRAGRPACFVEPELASFDQARAFIGRERRESDLCLVALDQPTVVPNETGSRPVDRIAASLISWLGGGVQPANLSKRGMFDDAAPIWRFKEMLDAAEDPEAVRDATSGLFLTEVFPALALPTFAPACFGRNLGPRYNPARRKTFRSEHWHDVLAAVGGLATNDALLGIVGWQQRASAVAAPRKADQDKLDAVVCALIGHHWLTRLRENSIMIGDLVTGYLIAPASAEVRARLTIAAMARGVPIDGIDMS